MLLTTYICTAIDIGIVIRNEQDITITERVNGGCTRDRLISSSSIRSVTSANANSAERTLACTLDALQSACKKNATLLPSSSSSPALRVSSVRRILSDRALIQIARGTERVTSQESQRACDSCGKTRCAINELEDCRASRNGDMCLIQGWRDDGASTRAITKDTQRDWRGERSLSQKALQRTSSTLGCSHLGYWSSAMSFLTKILRLFNNDDACWGIFYIL